MRASIVADTDCFCPFAIAVILAFASGVTRTASVTFLSGLFLRPEPLRAPPRPLFCFFTVLIYVACAGALVIF